MMKHLLLLMLFQLLAFGGFAQKVHFEDPELQFEFEKPEGWHVFDDGLWVKASPSAQDTSFIYVSITYYEDAVIEDPEIAELLSAGKPDMLPSEVIIDQQEVLERTEDLDSLTITHYSFVKYGQRFEIDVCSPLLHGDVADDELKEKFDQILSSIKVSRR